MIGLSKLRCYKDYRPLNIINLVKKGKESCAYKIVLGKKQKIGSFELSPKGMVSSLIIKKKFRKTKTGVHALISIYEFICKKAKETGIDCLWFRGVQSNKNNVVRLYSKFSSAFPELDNSYTFLLSINRNGQEIVDMCKKPVDMATSDDIEYITAVIEKIKDTLNKSTV